MLYNLVSAHLQLLFHQDFIVQRNSLLPYRQPPQLCPHHALHGACPCPFLPYCTVHPSGAAWGCLLITHPHFLPLWSLRLNSIFAQLILFLIVNSSLFYLCVYFGVFTAAHGLFSSCGKQQVLSVGLCRFLIVVASLIAEHGLQSMGSVVVAYKPAHLPLGMWDLPGPGIEPVSPRLAGIV